MTLSAASLPRPPQAGSAGHRSRCRVAAALAFALLWTGFPAAADMLGHGGMVRGVAVSPDGQRVLTASFDYTLRLWGFVEQTDQGSLDGHHGPVNAARFLPGGRQAVSVSDDGAAILWNLDTLKPIRRFVGHKHKAMGVALTADGKKMATGGWDKTVRLWTVADGALVKTIEQDSPVNGVAFANKDRIVAAGAHDGKIRLSNVETGDRVGVLEGHERGISTIVASPDGRLLASAGIDKTVRVWDVATQTQLRVFKHHDDQVYGVAFTPDGQRVVSAGRDGFLIVWNLTTGEAMREIKAHDRIVWSVAATPDGRFVVSGSSDDTARVWHLESGDRIGLVVEAKDELKPWLTSSHPGAKLYTKCARCHSLSADGPKRSGPHFAGLFGRKVGSVEGYHYSRALKGKDFVWNDKTLFELFDKGPDIMLPGTKMPAQRVPDTTQLEQLIAYLRQLTTDSPRN